MELFEYKGRNQRGEIMHGTIDSPNSKAVAAWLIAAGIYPIQIQVKGDKLKHQPAWLQALQVKKSVGLRDLLLFTRQMGTMVKSGVPMIEALSGIQKSTANKVLAGAIRDIRANLEKGFELHRAMFLHPHIFNEYYVSMVKVGEDTGKLEEIFKRLHEQIEFEKHMTQKIKGALRYPTYVLISISIAIAILTIFIIPVFAKIFTKFHATLPLLTQILLATSDFAVHYWWVVLAMIGGVVYAFKRYTRQPSGRYVWDRFKLRIPIMGSIIKKATLARFCRSFAMASESGVPLMLAFSLVSRVVDNTYFEERILLMGEGVGRGESLLRVAQASEIFTSLELQMISVGEATGNIDSMLNQVADMYQEEVEYEVSILSETIEPILLGFMGVLILILMLGVFLPMWDLGTVALKKH